MCGYSHHLHYNKRLRPKTTSAALLVGSALDEAINSLLTNEGDPMEVFMSKWSTTYINGVQQPIKGNPRVVYAESDFDADVLKEEDIQELQAFIDTNLPDYKNSNPLDTYSAIKSIKKNPFKKWSDKEQEFYNTACWLSWTRKVPYILEAYKTEVLPKIKKVVAVQKKIEMSNGEDTVEGFIDLIAEWENGVTYILDNKSSTREYEEGAPSTKPQLHLYAIAENNPNVGYIVYMKNLAKDRSKICSKCGHVGEGRHKTCDNVIEGSRCNGTWEEKVTPRGKIQILLGKTNPVVENMVLENINDVNKMLKNQMYVKNLNSCDNWYGGKCPYYNYCYNNKTDDLEEV